MLQPKKRLAELVQKLEAMGDEIRLNALADVLRNSGVTLDDVSNYVHENERNYHRALVAKTEHFDLLILTWLPGQGSPPHDHAGSVSSMMVLQGTAAEGSWRIAADGYAELEYETMLQPGQLTAWQDAGVHTVRNPSLDGDRLVTLHVYAPPLGEFRRYVSRPAGLPRQMPATDLLPVVAVVGGGFSGAMTSAQLLRQAEAIGLSLKVVLIERLGTVGEGIAYGTRNPTHLLNVPAGRMGAWPDKPEDFLAWARHRNSEVQSGDFLPRQWYGEYVRESLLATASKLSTSELAIVYDEVRRLAPRPNGGWMVHFAHGRSMSTDAVVLAIGHRQPSDPIRHNWEGPRERFVADPWLPFSTNVIEPDDPVIILGSGLTAVDIVMSLNREPRRAPIWLVSRRGLVPLAHTTHPTSPMDLKAVVDSLEQEPPGRRAAKLFRALRKAARDAKLQGKDWRSVVDGVRPHSSRIWRMFDDADRRLFLTSLRPFWEVHRHRMAVEIGQKFDALREKGLVQVVPGRVLHVKSRDQLVRMEVRRKLDGAVQELEAAWVINCTGPEAANYADANPVIGSLLVNGEVHPDAFSLGLQSTADGRVVGATGKQSPDLYLVGTLRKPSTWESTAVPELRTQASEVATQVIHWLQEARTSSVGAGI